MLLGQVSSCSGPSTVTPVLPDFECVDNVDAGLRGVAAGAHPQTCHLRRLTLTLFSNLQLEAEMVDFHKQQAAWMDRLPEAPTFRPTREQFEDPLAYIRSIQQEAAAHGAKRRHQL